MGGEGRGVKKEPEGLSREGVGGSAILGEGALEGGKLGR